MADPIDLDAFPCPGCLGELSTASSWDHDGWWELCCSDPACQWDGASGQGPLPTLRRVLRAYHGEIVAQAGEIDLVPWSRLIAKAAAQLEREAVGVPRG